jgi:excisionase family DNA binding protein
MIRKERGRVMADDQEVLTVKEVCDLLRVHPTTLYKLAKQGKIPSFRVGTDWRFRKDAVLRWMVEVDGRSAGESSRKFKN